MCIVSSDSFSGSRSLSEAVLTVPLCCRFIFVHDYRRSSLRHRKNEQQQKNEQHHKKRTTSKNKTNLMSAVGRPSRRRRFVVNARALPASPKTRLALDGRSDNLNPPLPTPDRVPSFAACVETRDHTCACSLKAIGAKTTAHVPFFHPPLPGSERVVLNSCVVVMASSLRAAPETRGRERVTPDASSCDRLERVIM